MSGTNVLEIFIYLTALILGATSQYLWGKHIDRQTLLKAMYLSRQKCLLDLQEELHKNRPTSFLQGWAESQITSLQKKIQDFE